MDFLGKVIATRVTPNGLKIACIKTAHHYGDLPLVGPDSHHIAEGDAVRLVPVLQVKEGRLSSMLRVELAK